MKLVAFLLFFPFFSCAQEQERTFTASTPASPVVRSFLGISLSDSIDFIRWKVVLKNAVYSLQCNYGISKPNTNGFISGGKKIELKGELEKEKNYYRLKNGNAVLHIVELNENLLHLLNAGKSLLVGNAGWSYTLNNIHPAASDKISIRATLNLPQDSMVFSGRTPCNIPGVIPEGMQCYKLKWQLVLYAGTEKNGQASYKVVSTAWRKESGRYGNWEIVTGKNGSVIYQLSDANGNPLLYLLKADENILLFTDAEGNLLTGDEDFSYTLNRK